jgi:glucose-1-phosphatase
MNEHEIANTPALLLFDLGGVLIENDACACLNRLLPLPLADASIKERWLVSPAVRRFELGEISPQDFAEKFIAEWGIKLPADAFLHEFIAWPKGFYPEARETIRVLRQMYRVGCLSNSNSLHWEKFGGFQEDFDIALSSHRLGAIKPDQEAFTRALSECGVNPSEVCFFDDILTNVNAAQSIGMRAFQVDGFNALQNVLRRLGLFPRGDTI